MGGGDEALAASRATCGPHDRDCRRRGAADGNHAERGSSDGLRERLTARNGRLEWQIRVPSQASGRLALRAAVDAARRPQKLGNGWRWPVGGGRAVTVRLRHAKTATG